MSKEMNSDDKLKLRNQLCFPLYAAARKVTNRYTPYLKPLGITYTQYLVFMVLWEEDDVQVGDLCKKLFLDSGTLTPLLKKMEENGYVERYRCADDERCVKIRLTDAGRAVKDKVKDVPDCIGACVPLSQEEAATLYLLLYKLLDVL